MIGVYKDYKVVPASSGRYDLIITRESHEKIEGKLTGNVKLIEEEEGYDMTLGHCIELIIHMELAKKACVLPLSQLIAELKQLKEEITNTLKV